MAHDRPHLPLTGACRCGQVRLRITAQPILTMACHCTGCQKMTAGPYSLSVAVPAAGFTVAEGEPVIGGLHGDMLHHFCCPHCLSWMFTRIEGLPDMVNVRATMLDDLTWYRPFIETYTCEKLAFAETGAAHSYERFPPMADFERLIGAYHAAR
ncbi:aldehyde-activating protein [Rhizobium sp. Leaf371]|uniref:GFA family protein n=1 Tax=Rhizobium sp. Leaf371 TaxID=1736355 RepID=UPI000713F000|nr:GFA family protein [Rhizobium sp. Leaf371]KQS65464.1 aldehyde-activating protein [Rhizobium sp. Leaf371]